MDLSKNKWHSFSVKFQNRISIPPGSFIYTNGKNSVLKTVIKLEKLNFGDSERKWKEVALDCHWPDTRANVFQ